jgi:hypothetical protein
MQPILLLIINSILTAFYCAFLLSISRATLQFDARYILLNFMLEFCKILFTLIFINSHAVYDSDSR